MYKTLTTISRVLQLAEKQNQGFFSLNEKKPAK